MSAIELWVFITAVACVGVYLAVDRSDDAAVASTQRLTARKPPK